MADIKRTLSGLLSIYPDNTTGQISPQDLRDGIVSMYGSHSVSAVSADLTLDSNSVFVDCDTSSGALAISLPDAAGTDAEGLSYANKFFILDNSGSNDVNLSSLGGNIDSGASKIIPAGQTASMISDGTNWRTFSDATGSAGLSGPGSSTDRALATWNSTSGTDLRDNSTAILSSDGHLTLSSTTNTSAAHLLTLDGNNPGGDTILLMSALNAGSVERTLAIGLLPDENLIRLGEYSGGIINGGVTVDSLGNVGINTTSPKAVMDILLGGNGGYGGTPYTAADDLLVQNSGSTGITIGSGLAAVGNLVFADSNSNLAGRIGYDHSNDSMSFYTTSAEAMRIDSSQKVGIGTSIPVAKFEVENSSGPLVAIGDSATSATGTQSIAIGRNCLSTANYTVAIGDTATASADWAVAIGESAVATGSESLSLGYGNDVDSTESTAVGAQNNVYAAYANAFGHSNNINSSGNNGLALGDSNSVQDSYGVAIGRSNTAAAEGAVAIGNFNVASGTYATSIGGQNLTTSGSYSFGINLDSTSRTLSVDNTMAIMGGNVGIGTTSPDNILHILKTTAGSTVVTIEKEADDAYLAFRNSAHDETWAIGNDVSNSNAFAIAQAGTGYPSLTSNSLVVVTSAGNVGIGTSSPYEMLDVANNIACGSELNFDMTTNANSEGWINYDGYQSGNTHYRSLKIGDGKRNTIMTVDAPNARVGIGTTSPNFTLHLHNPAASSNYMQFTNTDTGTAANNGVLMGIDGNEDFLLGHYGAKNIMFYTNGVVTPDLVITSAGNIGINETSPLAKLHVKEGDSGVTSVSAVADTLFVENSGDAGITIGSGTASMGVLLFADSGDSDAGYVLYDHSINTLKFGTGSSPGSTKMVIKSDGKVGIGTENPSVLLDVNGEIKANDLTVDNNLTVTGDLTILGTTVSAASETVLFSDNILVVNNGETGAGVTNTSAGIQVDRGTENDYFFLFDEATDLFRVGELNTEQAVATREDSPQTNGITSWNSTLNRLDTISSIVIDRASERMGIGVASPGYQLELGGTPVLYMNATDTNADAELTLDSTGTGQNYITFKDDASNDGRISVLSGEMQFQTGGFNTAMTIDSSQNVGIGTTSPGELLEVSDTVGATIRINSTKDGTWSNDEVQGSLEFYGNDGSSGGTGVITSIKSLSHETLGSAFALAFSVSEAPSGESEAMRIDYNGKVGIGTTSPDAKLDVDGAIAIKDGVAVPSTVSGKTFIYVDTADGDLKVKFGDGTIKTLSVDT